MNRKQTWLFILLSLYSTSGEYTSRDVALDQGVVRGYNIDYEDVISFYGIPYASVPTGDDKFKAPLPPRSWDGIFNATDNKSVCLQERYFDPEILDAVKVSDCLTVSIFIPKDTNETNLPVFQLIHGGAYQFGYGNQWFPGGLVTRGMIVVTFNYRVGLHGFLCLNTEFAPGNAGTKDIIAALKWVKENIARFGGDPDNISLAGTSSGSSAAEHVLLSPMSEGLISRIMLEGGGALTPTMKTMEPIKIAERYANQFGVYTNENVSLLESFYRSLSDEQLNIGFISDEKIVGFVPCIETHNLQGIEKFFSEAPHETLKSGNYAEIPVMTGYTPFDGTGQYRSYEERKVKMEANLTDFLPWNVPIESEEHALELTERIRNMYFPSGEVSDLAYIDFYTDKLFSYAQYSSARLHARNGVPVYLYFFTFNGTINLPHMRTVPISGPGHVAQSMYIYDYDERSIYDDITEEDWIIRNRLRDIYYSFCKDGNPNIEGLSTVWLPVSVETVHTLYMDEEFYMDETPLRERMEFWDQIYKYDYTNVAGSACVLRFSLFTVLVSFIILLGNSFIL